MRIFQRADSPTSVSFQQYCFKYSNVAIWHLRSNSSQYTGVMAQWLERLPQNRKVVGSSPDRVIPKNGTHCLLFCRSMHENGAGKLSTRSYQWTCSPPLQPSLHWQTCGLWLPETEIGTALCAIGARRTYTFFEYLVYYIKLDHKSHFKWFPLNHYYLK